MLYNKKEKAKLKPFFGAADLLKSKNINFKIPQNIIMLPFLDNDKYVKNLSQKTVNLLGDGNLDVLSGKLGVITFGLGAPLTAIIAEIAAELGAKNFVILGIAGGIAPNLKIADAVLCTGAFCDDGTAPNYTADDFVPADAALIKKLEAQIPRALKGHTWTTDALFRETKEEVLFYAKQGAATVEMEASALFAVAQNRNLAAAGVFVISDLLSPEAWRHEPNRANYNAVMDDALKKLIDLFK